MTTINSVLGPIDSADIGFTLMHEHVLCAFGGINQNYPELLGEDPLGRGVAALEKAKAGGVKTIVDATVIDIGRDIDLIAEVSRQSGVNVIAASGWWLHVSPFLGAVSADQLSEVFVREIEVGIAGTGIKSGILKSASDVGGVTAEAEMVLRAIARAHRRTGAPIMLHSYPTGQVGKQQLAILKEEGVDPKRIKIDHSNDTTDVEYLTWILEQGCYLGLDRYPGGLVSHRQRTNVLKELIDLGWADKLCVSHDHLAVSIQGPDPALAAAEQLKRNPHGFLFINEVVFTQLSEMGVSQEVIDGLCVNGPRNFWEGI